MATSNVLLQEEDILFLCFISGIDFKNQKEMKEVLEAIRLSVNDMTAEYECNLGEIISSDKLNCFDITDIQKLKRICIIQAELIERLIRSRSWYRFLAFRLADKIII